MVTLFGITMWTIMRLHWANIFDNHLYSTLLLRSTFSLLYNLIYKQSVH